MEGGEYKTQGVDTCVYIPHVACARKGKTIRQSNPGTEFVSRITRDEYEVKVQKAVVKALDAIAVKGDGISQFFNLADNACAPKFKPEDKKERCTVADLQYNQGLINLVTPEQGDTLYRSIFAKSKSDALIKSSLKGLMLAMVQLNAEKVTHSDSHFNNLGWIGDQLVIFDWGRGTVGLEPFKAWARRYLAWDKAQQENWKNLSQHTLQFSLLDLYPVQLTQLSSKGLFSTILSVWDTLGLLGPARAAGVVSEEKAKAFADDIFKSIKEKPNQSLTEKLKVMIPTLFGDPPAIHPIVAEKPMPPAEAKAVSRIIPAESSVVEVKAAPAPAADPDKKKLEDMKDACRKLLAPGGGRRRTFRRKRHQKGGDYLDGGADTLVWDRKPTADKPWLGLPIALTTEDEARRRIPEKLVIPPGFSTLTKYGDPVVRMVLLRAGEMEFHRALKLWSGRPENEFVKMHLNTFAGGNGVYSTHPKVVLNDAGLVAKATALDPAIKAALDYDYFPGKAKKRTEVTGLAAGSGKWYGLITRRQKTDIKKLDPVPAIRALVTLTQPLLRTDGFWIHYDLHDGNMALMMDDTPVIHDYGRMRFRDYDLKKLGATTASFPWHRNTNILRNVISVIAERPGNYESYRQFYYVTQLVTALNANKDVKERLNDSCYNPDEAGAAAASASYELKGRRGLERKKLRDMVPLASVMASRGSLYEGDPVFVPNGSETMEKSLTVTDLNTKLASLGDDAAKKTYLEGLFKDPKYETRYHHIARIWDLLAVLKAIGEHAEKAHTNRPAGAPPDADYNNVAVLSRGTARKLIGLVKAIPFSFGIRDQVKTIVNKFCVGAIALLKQDPKIFTPLSEDEQNAEAARYWETTNEARSGPAPPRAPAPAATSGGDDLLEELEKLGREKDETLVVDEEKLSPDREEDPEEGILLEKKKAFPPDTAAPPPPVSGKPPVPPPRAGRLTRRRRLPRLY